MSESALTIESVEASTRALRGGDVLAFWPLALLGLGGLATIAWIGALAWLAVRGALNLLHLT